MIEQKDIGQDAKLRVNIVAAVDNLVGRAGELRASGSCFDRGIGAGVEVALQALFSFTGGEVGRDYGTAA